MKIRAFVLSLWTVFLFGGTSPVGYAGTPLVVAIVKQDRVCGIASWERDGNQYRRGRDVIPIEQAFPSTGLTVADVDGDGREDFVWSYRDKTRDVAVTPIGNWDGTSVLRSRRHVETDWKFQITGLASVALGDSSFKRLVVGIKDDKGESFLRVMDCRQDPPKSLTYAGYLSKSTSVEVTALACGDLDQSGQQVLIVAIEESTTSSALGIYLLQSGEPITTTQVGAMSPGFKISALAIGDVDGDGKSELLVGMTQGGKSQIRMYEVPSSGGSMDAWKFKSEIKLPVNQEVRGLAVLTSQ